ncbi:hypothetical protein [Conexibacter sp. SYSU D00693]|uniref:hypothetical protein n=1 Tax=Conexibacter sp. SYSU D00693 TaxID=2812560 RepID=UPI00196B809B|nr:hypothetical protein [Conexibacter sp. SYSU D00693]
MSRGKTVLAGLAVGAALGALAAPTEAATLVRGPSGITYYAAAGEHNVLQLSTSGNPVYGPTAVQVTDQVLIWPGSSGCLSLLVGSAVCSTSPFSFSADLRDGDDVVRTGVQGALVRPNHGADLVQSGPALRIVEDEPPAASRGDRYFATTSSLTYGGRATVAVTLDGMANDGAPGEGDDVRTGSVTVTGAASTSLTGNADANGLSITDGGGAVAGLGGDDVLAARGGDIAVVDGGAGADHLLARSGTIVGGPGRDHVSRADQQLPVAVLVRDGEADEVLCDPAMTVVADPLDTVLGACGSLDVAAP